MTSLSVSPRPGLNPSSSGHVEGEPSVIEGDRAACVPEFARSPNTGDGHGRIGEVTDPECALCTGITPAGKPVSPMERNQGVIVGKYSHERAAQCERADLSSAAIIQSPFYD